MCVRCGACLNVCPVFREIGGHAYGSTYSGPIGSVISPMLNNDVTNVEKLPHASTLCGACRDACPVIIDLPRLLLDLRSDQVQDGDAPWLNQQAMQGFARVMQSPSLYENAGKMGGIGTGLLAGLSGGNDQNAAAALCRLDKESRLSAAGKEEFPVAVARTAGEKRKEIGEQ